MGTVRSIRIGAADNGFTLSYCEETKKIGQGTYSNTEYKDVELVYNNAKDLIVGITNVIGKLTKSDGSKAVELKVEIESEPEMEG